MPIALKSNAAYADAADPHMPWCPHCQGALQRIHRRPIDRALSWFAPVKRYRCLGFSCQWQGNIRARPGRDSAARDFDTTRFGVLAEEPAIRVPRTFVASMAAALAGAVFIVMLTYTDWLSPSASEDALASESTWRTSTVVAPTTQPARAPVTK